MRLYKLISPALSMIILVGLLLYGISFDDAKYDINNADRNGIYAGVLQKNIDNDINGILEMNARNYDIIKIAFKEIGNVGGEKYWRYCGFNSRQSWCCMFVSWCADQCGLIDEGIIPRFLSIGYGYNWFVNRGQWLSGYNTPEPGMIIFFDFTNADLEEIRDGHPDHVGIVKNVKDGYIYCIEGNYKDTCQETRYEIGNYNILGFGTPEY